MPQVAQRCECLIKDNMIKEMIKDNIGHLWFGFVCLFGLVVYYFHVSEQMFFSQFDQYCINSGENCSRLT